jgi:hypothetical protein
MKPDPDVLHEASIHLAWKELMSAPTPDLQRAAFATMRDLIRQRSPQQIERMEVEQGLR